MNDLKTILKKYDLKPNKLLGQNFLIDRAVLEKIIGAADLSKKDTVLEVGPGLGILTEELAKRAGEVIAVEKDKRLVSFLQKRFDRVKNIDILQGDAMKFNSPQPPLKLRGGEGELYHYKLVANIPYYLTSHLIRKFLEAKNPPREMILMVQKEVAQRICANPPEMSLLAVSVQFYAEPKIMSFVSKKSFWPRPKVDSAIIKITPRNLPPLQRGIEGDLKTITKILPNPPLPKEGTEHFFRIVHAGFSHPRKQLINNLNSDLKIDRAKIAAALKKIGLAPEQRAETLSVEDWIKLTKQLSAVMR
jgi:16S rRNA (adenine1518-N6/adenine1519-N6)-dimethyltransferase